MATQCFERTYVFQMQEYDGETNLGGVVNDHIRSSPARMVHETSLFEGMNDSNRICAAQAHSAENHEEWKKCIG